MLSSEDRRHLDAAQGWLGLGQFLEANDELEAMTPAARARPDVLLERLRIYALAKKWEWVREVGRALLVVYAKHPEFNYHMAQACAQTGRLDLARDFLKVPFASENCRAWKLRSLDDPALAPLWTA